MMWWSSGRADDFFSRTTDDTWERDPGFLDIVRQCTQWCKFVLDGDIVDCRGPGVQHPGQGERRQAVAKRGPYGASTAWDSVRLQEARGQSLLEIRHSERSCRIWWDLYRPAKSHASRVRLTHFRWVSRSHSAQWKSHAFSCSTKNNIFNVTSVLLLWWEIRVYVRASDW